MVLHRSRYESARAWLRDLERQMCIPGTAVALAHHRVSRAAVDTVAHVDAATAGPSGAARLSVRQLAHRTGLPVQTVRQVQLFLIEIGFCVYLHRPAGGRRLHRQLNHPPVLLDAEYAAPVIPAPLVPLRAGDPYSARSR
jgi:hypothetical protein